MKSIPLILVSVLISVSSVRALTPNLPAGALTPDFGIMTRLGTCEHAINTPPL
jgi:hypothetical protein